MNESVQLGAVILVGEHDGPMIRVTSGGDEKDGIWLTAIEWQSLLAIADTQREAEREIVRLRKIIAPYDNKEATHSSIAGGIAAGCPHCVAAHDAEYTHSQAKESK